MTSLTFYGGVNEIGGNKILLEDQDTRLFLDFGMSFHLANQFFEEYLKPRKCNGILDLTEFGLLPDLQGIYRCDYLEHCRLPLQEDPSIDAVLLSHAHMDHSAYVHYLRDDIPLFCSKASQDIMRAMDDTGKTGTCELVSIKNSFNTHLNTKGEQSELRGEKIPRPYHEVDGFFVINGLRVEALQVSHSLEGANAYILETSSGSVVYTGDFRFHGYKGDLTRKFAKRATEVEPEILICEGTRINDLPTLSEDSVRNAAQDIVSKTENLAVVNFPIRDTDRMLSFFKVAQETDRALVINLKQAYLLKLFEGSGIAAPHIDDEHIRIYIPRKDWGIYRDNRFSQRMQEGQYDKWERPFLYASNAITARDIRENQGEYIFRCDFYELKELIDIKPKEGSSYIWSVSEPFDLKTELTQDKVDNWLKHFELYPYEEIHASGHLSHDEIREFIETVSPQTVISVHTQYPEVFQTFHDNVIIPEIGQEIVL